MSRHFCMVTLFSGLNYLFLFILIGIMCLLLLIALLIVVALVIRYDNERLCHKPGEHCCADAAILGPGLSVELMFSFSACRRRKKQPFYTSPPASLSKIDNLDNMRNNQKQKQESPLLRAKQQYGVSHLEKTPTPTYPSNFAYNYDTVDKDGSPALIGGMKKRRNKPAQLGEDGQITNDPESFEEPDDTSGKLEDSPAHHPDVDSPGGEWKPLLPPHKPSGDLFENSMSTFKPVATSDDALPHSSSPNARPTTLALDGRNGPRLPPVPRRNNPDGSNRPVPPPKPKMVQRPSDGFATMPLHPTPPEMQDLIASNTSPRSKARSKNPASARLLEYCDELLAELEHMAKN